MNATWSPYLVFVVGLLGVAVTGGYLMSAPRPMRWMMYVFVASALILISGVVGVVVFSL